MVCYTDEKKQQARYDERHPGFRYMLSQNPEKPENRYQLQKPAGPIRQPKIRT